MHRAHAKLTYDDYVLIPEDGKRHEIIDGEHYVSAAPAFYHQQVSTRLAAQFVHAVDEPGLGLVVTAPVDVQLSPHDIVQPDLVVVLHENRSIITPTKVKGSPDLLIEILSPSNVRHDRERKHRLYERAGVREYWIVDPADHVVEQFVLEDGRFTLAAEHAAAIRLHVRSDVSLDLARVW